MGSQKRCEIRPETLGHGGSLVGDSMARHTSKTHLKKGSPKGFWHLPGDTPQSVGVTDPCNPKFHALKKEHGIICKLNLVENHTVNEPPSPWTVPRKRKSRGKKGRRSHFISTEGELYFERGDEVVTQNSFTALEDILVPG